LSAVAVLALLVAFLLAPGGAPARQAKEMIFGVTYKAEKIRYTSDVAFRCGSGPLGFFNHEEDTINNWRAVYSISIPARGDPGEVKDRANETSEVQPHAWRVSGGTAQCAGAVTKYACHGTLRFDPDRDGNALLSGDTFNQGKKLALLAEPVTQWRVRNPSGELCNRNNSGQKALLPAADAGYMPKMVTPQLEVSVARMRRLQDGEGMAIQVDSQNNAINASHPPHECDVPDADQCTQTLTWNGTVRIQRLK